MKESDFSILYNEFRRILGYNKWDFEEALMALTTILATSIVDNAENDFQVTMAQVWIIKAIKERIENYQHLLKCQKNEENNEEKDE